MVSHKHKHRVHVLSVALALAAIGLLSLKYIETDAKGVDPYQAGEDAFQSALARVQEMYLPIATTLTAKSDASQHAYLLQAQHNLSWLEREQRQTRLDIAALKLVTRAWSGASLTTGSGFLSLTPIPCLSADSGAGLVPGCLAGRLAERIGHASVDIRQTALESQESQLTADAVQSLVFSLEDEAALLRLRHAELIGSVVEMQRMLGGHFAIVPEVSMDDFLAAQDGVLSQERAHLRYQLMTGTDPVARRSSVRSGSGVVWPVRAPVSTTFLDPEYFKTFGKEHLGVDLAANEGTSVRSMEDGIVILAQRAADDGFSYVLVVHPGGLATMYGHLSAISVGAGDIVRAGDFLGESGGQPGTSGAGVMTTGPHLHFQVFENGVCIDPLKILPNLKHS